MGGKACLPPSPPTPPNFTCCLLNWQKNTHSLVKSNCLRVGEAVEKQFASISEIRNAKSTEEEIMPKHIVPLFSLNAQ